MWRGKISEKRKSIRMAGTRMSVQWPRERTVQEETGECSHGEGAIDKGLWEQLHSITSYTSVVIRTHIWFSTDTGTGPYGFFFSCNHIIKKKLLPNPSNP